MKLALGRAHYDPCGPTGKTFFSILATFAEFEADLISMRTREGMAIARAKGNSAACTPRASIPSAISPSSSPSQDQPSIVHSTGTSPLSVRSCPLPESTPYGHASKRNGAYNHRNKIQGRLSMPN